MADNRYCWPSVSDVIFDGPYWRVDTAVWVVSVGRCVADWAVVLCGVQSVRWTVRRAWSTTTLTRRRAALDATRNIVSPTLPTPTATATVRPLLCSPTLKPDMELDLRHSVSPTKPNHRCNDITLQLFTRKNMQEQVAYYYLALTDTWTKMRRNLCKLLIEFSFNKLKNRRNPQVSANHFNSLYLSCIQSRPKISHCMSNRQEFQLQTDPIQPSPWIDSTHSRPCTRRSMLLFPSWSQWH